MPLNHDIFDTPFGWIGVLASPLGIRRATLPQHTPDEAVAQLGPEAIGSSYAPEGFNGFRHAMEAYFRGDRPAFEDIPLDLAGAPPFLAAAWAACRSIPYGETRSYKWLAEQAGNPRALRAAGQSMARNRIPIVIPCHRVLASSGALHGFGKGATQLDLKAKLLAIEQGSGRRF
ncbi:MAG: methylated-DNA--[protein]-cysteine S-methyltransferase [SAR202 cluster bacterium]|nr:methylated-DNA--[protein]-cysteine S-methyltransferase [SAR202 cluster bacterium]